MTKGRRLRLDRRKAGLSQEELAKQLGHTLEEISAMENDRLEPSQAALQFSASLPARVPRASAKAKLKAAALETPEEQPPAEPKDGPGPRVDVEPPPAGDKPPAPGPRPAHQAVMARGEIAQLEDALLKMFAGERLVVPKQTPDGVVQVEAVIPGIAQVVGMWDEFDGAIIETYSPGMAKAWAELARVNPRVRSVLIGLTYGGAYRGVLAATLPAVVAIAAHHGAFAGPQQQQGPPPVEPPQPEDLGPQPPSGPEWNGGVPPGMESLFDENIG